MNIKAVAIGLHCFLSGAICVLWYAGYLTPQMIGFLCFGAFFGYLMRLGMEHTAQHS